MDSSFVHVDEAVAVGLSLLPENTTLEKAFARQWAYLGLRDIGPSTYWFQSCTLYPNSQLTLKKPDDMWKAVDIALYDSSNTELRYSYKGLGRRIHNSKHNLVEERAYNPLAGAPIDLSEDPFYFHLGSNALDENNTMRVSYAIIKYWKLPVGVDGLPLIPEQQVLTIAMFIRWMWSIRNNTNQSDRVESRLNYTAAKKESQSAAKMPSGIEFEQVAKEWSSFFGAPQFKQF